MRGKYFKLKLLLSLSLIFCIVGGVGSGILIARMYSNSAEYIRKNTKIVSKEIFRSKERIEALDLTKFSPRSIVVEKSTDGENSIEVSYNEITKNVNYTKDKKFPEKINIVEDKKEKYNSNLDLFDVVEKMAKEVLEETPNYMFDSDLYPSTKEKIVIRLTEPTEIIVDRSFTYRRTSNWNDIDQNLLKKELNFKYYINNLLNSTLVENGDIVLKEYDSSNLRLDRHGEDLNINVEPLKMKEFSVRGNASNINLFLDAKNIEDRVEIYLEDIYGNFEIRNANTVVINLDEFEYLEYILKFKEGEENKEYVIPSKYKSEEKKTIVIDAKTVFYNNGRENIKIK